VLAFVHNFSIDHSGVNANDFFDATAAKLATALDESLTKPSDSVAASTNITNHKKEGLSE
jgi:hypothetical protein